MKPNQINPITKTYDIYFLTSKNNRYKNKFMQFIGSLYHSIILFF